MLEHSEVSNKWPREETAVWPFRSVVSLTCQMTGELGVNLRPDFSLFFLYSCPNVLMYSSPHLPLMGLVEKPTHLLLMELASGKCLGSSSTP